jgi:hypothetical protein
MIFRGMALGKRRHDSAATFSQFLMTLSIFHLSSQRDVSSHAHGATVGSTSSANSLRPNGTIHRAAHLDLRIGFIQM